MRQISIAMFTLLLGNAASATDYTHNGSTMDVNVSEENVTIRYVEPRAGLQRVGVRPGTLLLEGRIDRSDPARPYLDGEARVFKRGCDPTPYFVYGDFPSSGSFMLNGTAPVLAEDGCAIIDNVSDGPNAELVFSPSAKTLKTSNPATLKISPDRSGSLCVVNIAAGGTLNVRSGPGENYGRVGRLAANDCSVAGLKQCIDGWCAVLQTSTGTTGWVAQTFIAPTR